MGVQASAVARVTGVDVQFVDLRPNSATLLPQQVALIGQGNTAAALQYDTLPFTVTSAGQVGETYGFGSPLHLAALQLRPVNGDGLGTIPLTIYGLLDDASGVVASDAFVVSGTATESGSIIIRIAGISTASIPIADTDTSIVVATAIFNAINAVLNMPVIAENGTPSTAGVDAKWEGLGGNGIVLEVIGAVAGISVAFATNLTGGLNSPDIDIALNQITSKWESILVNTVDNATATFDKISTWGDGRTLPTVKKRAVCFTGSVITGVANAIITTDLRKSDSTNAYINAPGSPSFPGAIAARGVARVARLANDDPAFDYAGQRLDGIIPGALADQWDYDERNLAVQGGNSTVELVDGVLEMSDTVTFYRPDSELPNPAYRYVVDITKIQSVVFSHDVEFESDNWKGHPLIPDGQATTNSNARQPQAAVAAVRGIIDGLALKAILSDPETAKKTVTANINGSNPKRLDVFETVQISGFVGILSVDLDFGFFFGVAPTVN